MKIPPTALASVAQLVGASSHRLKVRGFNSQSAHTPRVWVGSLVRVRTRKQSMDVSLSVSVSLPLPLPLSLSKNNEKMSLGEKKRKENIPYFPGL